PSPDQVFMRKHQNICFEYFSKNFGKWNFRKTADGCKFNRSNGLVAMWTRKMVLFKSEGYLLEGEVSIWLKVQRCTQELACKMRSSSLANDAVHELNRHLPTAIGKREAAPLIKEFSIYIECAWRNLACYFIDNGAN